MLMNFKRLKCSGHIAWMEGTGNAYGILVENGHQKHSKGERITLRWILAK
jgi:hypothetical protein